MSSANIHQNREFVRVQVRVPITISGPHHVPGGKKDSWILHGTTVNMTGSGMLVAVAEKPPADDPINLEFSLPTHPPECIKIEAHPIRTLQTNDNQWKIAYRFDTISSEERDKIIGCCLVEQRRMLRLNHGIRDSG